MRLAQIVPLVIALGACSATASTTAGEKLLVPPAECANPTRVIARSGESIARPGGVGLRLYLIYQGASVGLRSIDGVEASPPRLGPNAAGPVAGLHPGYWGELRDADGAKLFFEMFPDVGEREVPPAASGGEFSHVAVDRCEPKLMAAFVPNDPSATDFVVFGSPYGTQAPAVEIGRFKLGPPR